MSFAPEARADVHFDQVGALQRPGYLLDAFQKHAEGAIDEAGLRAAQDRSIRELIAKQEAVGMPIVSDGEHRRRSFVQSFGDAVPGLPFKHDPSLPTLRVRQALNERLAIKRNVVLEEFRFGHSLAKKPLKVTLYGPDGVFAYADWENSKAYKGADDVMDHIAALERQMVGELVAAGCRYISVDEPSYTSYVDPVASAAMIDRGEDVKEALRRSIRAENAMIEGFPGVTFGIHLCRGGANRPGRYKEGSYEAIADELFNGLKHHRFLLEYDTERAGGFEPLRFVPKGKIVVLGLVSTKLAEVESAEDLRRRIDEAARYIPLEQLALGAACGFGGSPGAAFKRMTEEDQWRKIERMLEVVDEVWGS